MSVFIAYHGTKKKAAESILHDNEFKFSISHSPSDANYYNLWLGDGFYLFEYDFYAFKWMVDDLKEKNDSSAIKKFEKNCCILSISVNYQQDRVFNTNNLEHRMLFDRILSNLIKMTPPNRGMDPNHFTDGLVINILFNEFKYSNKFDIVESLFPINKKNYSNFTQLRSGPLLQKQFCVKNKSVIVGASEFSSGEHVDNYKIIWKTLFPMSKPFGEVKKSIYTIDRGLSYEP